MVFDARIHATLAVAATDIALIWSAVAAAVAGRHPPPIHLHDASPAPPPPPPPTLHETAAMVADAPLLVISCGPDPSRYLINEKWASLTRALGARIDVVWATSAAEVAERLAYYVPAGILVLDAGFTANDRDCDTVLGLLNMYAHMGGTVVFAGVFPAVVEAPALRRVFAEFGLNWRFVGYELHAGARLHPWAGVIVSGHLREQLVAMPSVCELSQLTVRVQNTDDVLYEIYPQSTPRTHIESAVVMAPVGDGHVALVGDRENEETTRATILAMFKLVP